jgi:hypothetical protein
MTHANPLATYRMYVHSRCDIPDIESLIAAALSEVRDQVPADIFYVFAFSKDLHNLAGRRAEAKAGWALFSFS